VIFHKPMTKRNVLPTDAASRELRAYGLTYPGAHIKSPWPGHGDLAVKDKTFAYLTIEGEPFKVSCKLPTSSAMVVNMPFAKLTAYGLGKAGWVTMDFADGEVPVEMIKELIDESYRAVAPAKLQHQLDAETTTTQIKPTTKAKPRSKRTPTSRATPTAKAKATSNAKTAATTAKSKPATKATTTAKAKPTTKKLVPKAKNK